MFIFAYGLRTELHNRIAKELGLQKFGITWNDDMIARVDVMPEGPEKEAEKDRAIQTVLRSFKDLEENNDKIRPIPFLSDECSITPEIQALITEVDLTSAKDLKDPGKVEEFRARYTKLVDEHQSNQPGWDKYYKLIGGGLELGETYILATSVKTPKSNITGQGSLFYDPKLAQEVTKTSSTSSLQTNKDLTT